MSRHFVGTVKDDIPSTTLLDLGQVELKQAIKPAQQLLSVETCVSVCAVEGDTSTTAWSLRRRLSTRDPYLDSPMLSVLLKGVRCSGRAGCGGARGIVDRGMSMLMWM